jgi:glycosyltransferase involved in cell wall biosynthesis
VATDVGACREILEGRSNTPGVTGPGGVVAPVGASEDIAAAIASLLESPERLREYGDRLQQRVREQYRAEAVAAAYGALYARNFAAQMKVA